MSRIVEIPVADIDGEPVEPMQVTLDDEIGSGGTETTPEGMRVPHDVLPDAAPGAAIPIPADPCCAVKLPLDLAGAGMGDYCAHLTSRNGSGSQRRDVA